MADFGEDTIDWEDMDMARFLTVGSVISISIDSLLFPFDMVKTRLQVQGQRSAFSQPSFPRYYNLRHAIRTIRTQEGHFGLYKGFRANVLGSLPAECLYYTVYESFKHGWKSSYPVLQERYSTVLPDAETAEHLGILLAGGLAEMVSASIWIPTDIIAQKLMVQGPLKTPKYKGVYDCLRQIAKQDGWRGFYRGWTATALTFVPAGAVQWTVYESCRKQIYRQYPSSVELDQESLLPVAETNTPAPLVQSCIHLFCGTVAGATAAMVTNPMDVIKSRLQVQDYYSKQLLVSTTHQCTSAPIMGIRAMFRATVQQEGWRALLSGVQARMLYQAPVCGLTMLTYEMVKLFA
eukprot:CAMPEP_0177669734 /NCGR_PEP_ID=MMETSP0447-20121125/23644_1 /TAXON_ID=0 /ORGANISM="Stygamoeba regulata, Strain BSH-02190019" /LENGTH=348 /DNA_ID=CAMNT_0019176711 /DNA_START=171 /DNA_END=1214 /DNA_ORIENTATION=+